MLDNLRKYGKNSMFAQIIDGSIVVILRKTEILHTDALTISPLASRHTLVLRT